MKRLLPFLLALAAGCITTPAPASRGGEAPRTESAAEREAKDIVRESFEVLRQSWIDGGAMTSISMMSRQGISDWLLTRTRDTSDPDWKKLLARLDATRKVDFDLWVRENKRVKVPFTNDRSLLLPENVLQSTWLVELWKHYSALEPEGREIAKTMEVSEVYVDGTEASVLVKMGRTPARLYSMVLREGRWKFDLFVRPAGEVR